MKRTLLILIPLLFITGCKEVTEASNTASNVVNIAYMKFSKTEFKKLPMASLYDPIDIHIVRLFASNKVRMSIRFKKIMELLNLSGKESIEIIDKILSKEYDKGEVLELVTRLQTLTGNKETIVSKDKAITDSDEIELNNLLGYSKMYIKYDIERVYVTFVKKEK